MNALTGHAADLRIGGMTTQKLSLWQKASSQVLDNMEAKAFKKARKAGSMVALIRTTSDKDALSLMARGWSLKNSVSVGFASPTRHFLTKTL